MYSRVQVSLTQEAVQYRCQDSSQMFYSKPSGKNSPIPSPSQDVCTDERPSFRVAELWSRTKSLAFSSQERTDSRYPGLLAHSPIPDDENIRREDPEWNWVRTRCQIPIPRSQTWASTAEIFFKCHPVKTFSAISRRVKWNVMHMVIAFWCVLIPHFLLTSAVAIAHHKLSHLFFSPSPSSTEEGTRNSKTHQFYLKISFFSLRFSSIRIVYHCVIVPGFSWHLCFLQTSNRTIQQLYKGYQKYTSWFEYLYLGYTDEFLISGVTDMTESTYMRHYSKKVTW